MAVADRDSLTPTELLAYRELCQGGPVTFWKWNTRRAIVGPTRANLDRRVAERLAKKGFAIRVDHPIEEVIVNINVYRGLRNIVHDYRTVFTAKENKWLL